MEFCVTHTLTWNFVLHIHLQRYTPFCIYGYMHIQTRAHTGLNTRTHRDIHTWYAHMHIHALKDMFADLCVFSLVLSAPHTCVQFNVPIYECMCVCMHACKGCTHVCMHVCLCPYMCI